MENAPHVKISMLGCKLDDVIVYLGRCERASLKRWDRETPTVETKRRLLYLQHKSFGVLDQRNRCVPVSPGDLSYGVADEPYGMQLSDNTALLIVDVPEHAIDPGTAHPGDLIARSTPSAALLRTFGISLLIQHWPQEVDREEKAVLKQAIIGLAQSSFGHERPRLWMHLPQDDRQRVLAFIERNLADSALRTGAIAASLSLSVRTVHAIFVRMATTPTAYIINRRLGRAADLLTSHPEMPITYLAHELGFSDAAHLCRLFKGRFGVSPGRFAAARRAERK